MTAGFLAWLALMVVAWPALAQQPGPPGRFDAYVLALSWSPTFCEGRGGRSESEQCGTRRFGFVVHGLWPQYRQGGWPERCAVAGGLPRDVVESMLPLMPSRRLIEHEWRTHGTCDGTAPEAYFAKARAVRARVTIPEPFRAPEAPVTVSAVAVERAFIAVNPGLTADSLVVTCRGRFVAEVRVCLDRDLSFAACGTGLRDRCKGELVMPPLR